MQQHTRERGISIISLIVLLALLGFVGLVGLRLVPIYIESFKIDTAMKSVIDDSNLLAQSKRDIALALTRRLDLDDVGRITERNYPQYVDIDKNGKKVSISVRYKADTSLLANIGLVVDFDKIVEN